MAPPMVKSKSGIDTLEVTKRRVLLLVTVFSEKNKNKTKCLEKRFLFICFSFIRFLWNTFAVFFLKRLKKVLPEASTTQAKPGM